MVTFYEIGRKMVSCFKDKDVREAIATKLDSIGSVVSDEYIKKGIQSQITTLGKNPTYTQVLTTLNENPVFDDIDLIEHVNNMSDEDNKTFLCEIDHIFDWCEMPYKPHHEEEDEEGDGESKDESKGEEKEEITAETCIHYYRKNAVNFSNLLAYVLSLTKEDGFLSKHEYCVLARDVNFAICTSKHLDTFKNVVVSWNRAFNEKRSVGDSFRNLKVLWNSKFGECFERVHANASKEVQEVLNKHIDAISTGVQKCIMTENVVFVPNAIESPLNIENEGMDDFQVCGILTTEASKFVKTSSSADALSGLIEKGTHMINTPEAQSMMEKLVGGITSMMNPPSK